LRTAEYKRSSFANLIDKLVNAHLLDEDALGCLNAANEYQTIIKGDYGFS
jgi:hypothetical protein